MTKNHTADNSLDISTKLNRIDAILALTFEHFSSKDGVDIDPRHFEALINGSIEDLKVVRKALEV